MADSGLLVANEGGAEGRLPVSREDGRRKWVAISARTGVWGIIGGLVSLMVAPMAPMIGLGVAGLAFTAGGVGAIGTSILVMKELRRAPLPLKMASFVGLPFGMCLVLSSVGFLLGGPFLGLPLPFGLFAWALPTGVFLGVALMILLLAGFFSHAFFNRGSGWED